MTDWYFLLAPIAVLAVLLLFRFVGCGFDPGGGENYLGTVKGDGPVAFFLLRETAGATVAKNEIGTPDGIIDPAPPPIDAGDPNWHSTGVAQPGLDLGVTDPLLIETDTSAANCAIRFRGGSVQVSASVPPLNSLTEFTVEVMVYPDWDVISGLGKYYCVLESADFVPVNAQPPQQKNAGFGIYAGPDNAGDPASQYFWQVWLGVGEDGFERFIPVPYVDVPGNPVSNPGPNVTAEPTYLAFTFSQSQGQAFLYVYTENRDIDYTTYPLNPLPYQQAANALSIGVTPQGPLYPPFLGATPLYPFEGLIGDVAIYDRVLDESTLRSHVIDAFYNI
jgi:hypothetical protein